MKKRAGVLFLFVVLACSAALGRPGLIMFDGVRYSQELPDRETAAFPDWSPAAGACPLHPTNAIALAVDAATNSIPNARLNPPFTTLSLHSVKESMVWYYSVSLRLDTPPDSVSNSRNMVSVVVRLDGIVPPIRKTDPSAGRRFGNGFRRAPAQSKQMSKLTPEEQAKKREEVRENLRQYQMEVIRQGMSPLPIPLTQEMDDQLVLEGILPPKTNAPPCLTPEEQAQRSKEREEIQRGFQISLILAGKPLLFSGKVLSFTAKQKKQLEEKGIVFFEDGSCSNTTTGVHYPAVQ